MKRICLAIACFSLSLLAIGCASSSPQAEKKSDTAEKEVHGHAAGPHGGTVIDWGGGKYHVEFTVDHGKKEATVYILGSDEKTPVPVKATNVMLSINDPAFEVELKPQPLAGEADGASSRFVGTHDHLGTARQFAGTVSGEIEDTPYMGDFKE